MNISMTKKQYKTLLKLAMLGDWMTNIIPDNAEKDLQDTLQYILSQAKEFGLGKYVEFDDTVKAYFHTEAFEKDTGIIETIGNYHEYALWEGLVLEFSRRDLNKKYGEKVVEKMSDDERIEKEYPFIEKYENEFRDNGLDNLTLKKKRNTAE